MSMKIIINFRTK